MAEAISTGAVSVFAPILSFLLVFIVVYALLSKTKVLGESSAISLFISFLVSTFFVAEVSLVDFIRLNSAWMGVFAVLIFFVVLILAFLPGETPLEFLSKGNWFSWVVLIGLVAFFLVSASYVFKWSIDWVGIRRATRSDWFGFLVLVLVGAIASFVLTRKG